MLLEDLLLQSGVDYKPVRGSSEEVLLQCPFCTGSTDYSGSRFVFGLHLVSGKAHCFRCDFKSRSVVYTARELCKVWNIDFSWRLRLSATQCDVEVSQAAPEPQPLPVGLPSEYESFGDLTDEIERKAFDYLQSRLIGRKEIERYRIGFAGAGPMAWRVLFPVFGEDGNVYGCAGRDFSGIAKVKYMNTEGIKLLFNGQHKAKRAVVVEGPVDTIKVCRILKKHFPDTAGVGALGSAVTPQQLAQLAKYDSVIHFPDFDEAGVKGAALRADGCVAAGIETSIILPEGMDGSDPGSMSDTAIVQCIHSARPWTKSEKLRMRLRAIR